MQRKIFQISLPTLRGPAPQGSLLNHEKERLRRMSMARKHSRGPVKEQGWRWATVLLAVGMFLALVPVGLSNNQGMTMNTIQVGIYQDKLLRRKRETLSSLKRLEEEYTELTQQRQLDWIDKAQDETQIRLVDRLNEEYARELGRIQAALGRIYRGSYGFCQACHRAIEKRRLDSYPEAEFCSVCQDLREAFDKVA